MMWPGNAAVAVSVVHVAKGRDRESLGQKVLDEKLVPEINSRLRAKPERPDPVPLKSNANLSFQGTIVLGLGFVLTPDERDELIKKDKRNAERILPYIGGEEVNTNPTQDFSRLVICFSDIPKKAGDELKSLDEQQAKNWPDLYKRVAELVKPVRSKDKRAVYRENWWVFAEARPALYAARAGLSRSIARSLTSKHAAYAFQPSDHVLDQTLITFLLEAFSAFAQIITPPASPRPLDMQTSDASSRSMSGSSMRTGTLATSCFSAGARRSLRASSTLGTPSSGTQGTTARASTTYPVRASSPLGPSRTSCWSRGRSRHSRPSRSSKRQISAGSCRRVVRSQDLSQMRLRSAMRSSLDGWCFAS